MWSCCCLFIRSSHTGLPRVEEGGGGRWRREEEAGGGWRKVEEAGGWRRVGEVERARCTSCLLPTSWKRRAEVRGQGSGVRVRVRVNLNHLSSIVPRLHAASDSLTPEGIKALLLIHANDGFNGIMAGLIILNVQLLSIRNSVDSFLNHQPSSEEKQHLH